MLFILGGGEKAWEEEKKLAASLRDALGASYDVRYPEMQGAHRPEYEAWKNQVVRELAALDGEVVLVKYLSKEEAEKPGAGLFLIAAPYLGAENWEVEGYVLREDFAWTLPEGLPVFLYHSRDDEEVPFEHLALYSAKLPQATVREFDGRGHQSGGHLSEVAGDVRGAVGCRPSQT